MTYNSKLNDPVQQDWEQIGPRERSVDVVVTEEAIRALLARQDVMLAAQQPETDPDEQAPEVAVRDLLDDAEQPEAANESPGKTDGQTEIKSGRRWLRLPKYQPKWTHTMAVLGVTVMLAEPLLLPLLALLFFVSVIIAYFTIGHDRFFEMVLYGFEKLKKWRPQLAEKVMLRAKKWSARMTRIAAWLPESWTRGFYLPDNTAPEDLPDKMRQDPFEKLARQAREM